MKKIVYLFCVTMALVACSVGDTLDNFEWRELRDSSKDTGEVVSSLKFNITVNQSGFEDPRTKAVKSEWETGDVIYVFFENLGVNYLKMTYGNGIWSTVEMNGNNPGPLNLTKDGKMTAVYLPFGNNIVDNVGGSCRFRNVNYTYYLACIRTTYTISDGIVSGCLDMKVPEGFVQFFISDTDAKDGKTFLRESHITPKAMVGVDTHGYLNVVSRDKGASMIGYVYETDIEKGYVFSGELAEENRGVSTNYQFSLTKNSQTKILEGTKTLYHGNSENYTHRAIKLPSIDAWTETVDRREKVDLGVSVKWATCNLGADSPEEHGDYYAWGEVEPYYSCLDPYIHKDGKLYGYASNSYMLCLSSLKRLIKYNTNAYGDYGPVVDNKTSLEAMDDAATFQLGHSWRIPTNSEWNELRNATNFDWQWTSDYNGTGVSGAIVTRNNGPCKGNSIFLPTTGYIRNNERVSPETYGDYWSSTQTITNSNGSFTTAPDSAHEMSFYQLNSSVGRYNIEALTNVRCYGLAIRPVCE